MALQPKFYASHATPQIDLSTVSNGIPPNTIEVYLDYVCPFSGKLYKNWYDNLFPLLESKYKGKVQFVFRNYVQVWHPTSNLVHEASLAFASLDPSNFLKFSYILFEHIQDFYDTETADLSRNQIYEKVYDLVIQPNFPSIDKKKFLELLQIKKSDKPSNGGNSTQNDLKYFTKVGRGNGVHVTPTVLINGFKDGSFESSTPIEEVEKKIQALL
ncbi:hypothetical protein BN7_4918 [Wickerhamomyces ciferrii]|uniref:Thioredoxin-like fold domain-containing protein n=1 Tax=Wickerhamomyces ciferrii (strain ATCC 14091 / BCRC 22168 / CBS 111 / JCM 3599 / NBRC 0793 / NRRL Y-1031 F-60-10) TaxID=1206466 RepID=K0KQL0_WICCF|nr:uncharacterized protein BN7_4918 [Wickerhamomyces ciferrii]CCH45336.1 hypothetical protein BN7_4918 [Wickerhamomyces ciferrii]